MSELTLRSIYSEPVTVFSGVTVDTAYATNQSSGYSIKGADQIILYATWTSDSNGDNLDLQVEFSPDNSTWYIEQAETVSSGVVTVEPVIYRIDGPTASTAVLARIAIAVADPFARFSVKSVQDQGTASLTFITVGV